MTRCADVTSDMGRVDTGLEHYEAHVGDLLWDPKMGEGHVIVEEFKLKCECGEDSDWRDHHVYLLRR